jgi:hypothetical protein
LIKNFAYILIVIALYTCASSCSYLKKKHDLSGGAVARAFDHYLYKDDIVRLIPTGTSKDDSINIVKNFINSWIKQQVILHRAESNLAESEKDVEQQLLEYRNSLITYIYQQELIRQQLDTIVSNDEIEKYYSNNQRNFQLKDNILKVNFIKVTSKAPKLDKVRVWFRSDNSRDKKLLEEYCNQFASDFYFDDDKWQLFDDLLKKVPIKTYDKEEFLKNNRFIEVADSANLYLINIKGFMIKESLSPLSFEKDNIRNLIINKRKLQLVQEMEQSTYENALKNNDFEIYKN